MTVKAILLHVAVIAALFLLQFAASDYIVLTLTRIMVLAIYALGYNILFGYAGLLSLGHAMFFATGLYAASLGVTRLGLGVPEAFLLAVVIGIAVSFVLGLIVLRASGVAFMIVTLMFSQAAFLTVLYFGEYTRGDEGIVIPDTLRTFSFLGREANLADPVLRYNLALGFLALFFFFDVVDELQNVGKNGNGYQLSHALGYVLLQVPSHLYELMPISVLIGTIFVMARLAQSSEFTILRTSGLGPVRALRTLLGLGVAFVLVTFVVGDYLSPVSDRYAQLLKARYLGQITVGQTGAWLRERQSERHYAVNVARLSSDGRPEGIRIFEFDTQGQWLSLTQAQTANLRNDGVWALSDVSRDGLQRQGVQGLEREHLNELDWPTGITTEMISVALLKPERMGTVDLFQYIRHLDANGQTSQRYEIEFWKKLFYPLSCLVMVVLALPFAYLHFRSGNITSHVFGGVLAGISFFLLNNVFGYVGNLNQWSPWLAAAAPGLLYSMASLAAFGWLVLRQ